MEHNKYLSMLSRFVRVYFSSVDLFFFVPSYKSKQTTEQRECEGETEKGREDGEENLKR